MRKKGSLRRCRSGWEDNIKMYLKEVGLEAVGWIDLAQVKDKWQAVVNATVNFLVP
jgi:hypothetical protein